MLLHLFRLYEPIEIVRFEGARLAALEFGRLGSVEGILSRSQHFLQFALQVRFRLLHDGLQRRRADNVNLDLVTAAGRLRHGHVVKIVGGDLNCHRVAGGERPTVGMAIPRHFQSAIDRHLLEPQSQWRRRDG